MSQLILCTHGEIVNEEPLCDKSHDIVLFHFDLFCVCSSWRLRWMAVGCVCSITFLMQDSHVRRPEELNPNHTRKLLDKLNYERQTFAKMKLRKRRLTNGFFHCWWRSILFVYLAFVLLSKKLTSSIFIDLANKWESASCWYFPQAPESYGHFSS